MRCPYCQSDNDRVVDSRSSDGGDVIRRRRACEACLRRFTTYERVEMEMPAIVKKDGRRESYDRSKLQAGLRKALEKRPVPIEKQEQAIAQIERKMQETGEKELSTKQVGDQVLAALRDLDEVAYLRFASVYLSFRDLEELLKEVQSLMKARP
jgi:transcriptional repressor NrdR